MIKLNWNINKDNIYRCSNTIFGHTKALTVDEIFLITVGKIEFMLTVHWNKNLERAECILSHNSEVIAEMDLSESLACIVGYTKGKGE